MYADGSKMFDWYYRSLENHDFIIFLILCIIHQIIDEINALQGVDLDADIQQKSEIKAWIVMHFAFDMHIICVSSSSTYHFLI